MSVIIFIGFVVFTLFVSGSMNLLDFLKTYNLEGNYFTEEEFENVYSSNVD